MAESRPAATARVVISSTMRKKATVGSTSAATARAVLVACTTRRPITLATAHQTTEITTPIQGNARKTYVDELKASTRMVDTKGCRAAPSTISVTCTAAAAAKSES